ncbi:MAG: hypothetical protein IPI06_09020 [Gammaproteobacteria bacterium]|nr:hypothetical protein [Gammaproteobacteria bacterium]
MLHGIGIGMVTVPLSTLIFATLRADLRTEAGVISSLSRNIGSSIGISVVLMLLSRSTQSNHARLVEYLTPFDPARWDSAREVLGDRAMPVLAEEVGRQAAVIAYNNDFALVLGVAVIVLPLLALFRKPRPVPTLTGGSFAYHSPPRRSARHDDISCLFSSHPCLLAHVGKVRLRNRCRRGRPSGAAGLLCRHRSPARRPLAVMLFEVSSGSSGAAALAGGELYIGGSGGSLPQRTAGRGPHQISTDTSSLARRPERRRGRKVRPALHRPMRSGIWTSWTHRGVPSKGFPISPGASWTSHRQLPGLDGR